MNTVEDGTSTADRKLVVKAFEAFLEFGALSAERLEQILNRTSSYHSRNGHSYFYSKRDIDWVLNQLSAEKNSSELYTLPEMSTPKNWR